MKKSFIITVVLLDIFFLPKDVFAQTTITMCNSGCDYKSFDEVEDAFDKDVDLSKEIIWTSKDDTISIIDLDKILGLKEGNTTITGISSDGLNEYEIEVTVIKNPVTNSSIYITIGICVILILGTIIYVIYKRRIDN